MRKGEHGTTRSYVIGFILSLIFTVIPYFMVVNHTQTGNTLLTIILGIALVQMFVQIFFFLHLGRGPKPLYNVVFFFATAGLIVIVVGASLFIMSNLYRNMSPAEVTTKLAQDEGISQVGGQKTGACQGVKDSHIVRISDGKVNPIYIQAHLCDTLTFVNDDNVVRDIAFGAHPDHTAYGGEAEETIRKGRPKTITLNELGNYTFHDHLHPEVSGFFSVEPSPDK
jgi:cytochrome o ubiquinol oxidase operon protein cyoD